MVNSKIVTEIEKCYNECLKRAKITDSDYWSAKADAYRNVLVILYGTLEVKNVKKKSVSDYLEEAIGQSFIYHKRRGDDFRSDKQIETAYKMVIQSLVRIILVMNKLLKEKGFPQDTYPILLIYISNVIMGKKYELIPSNKEGLYRIKALKDFNDVKKGDIGGYVEGEKNLSQLGDCWIYDNAVVRDNAVVIGNTIVCDNARVHNNAQVCDNVIVRDNVQVWDNAFVMGNAEVCDNAQVCGKALVCDNARIRGHAVVQHDAAVRGNAQICGDAIISSDKDYIVFKNWWSSGRYFTWTRFNNMWKVGCFYGTGEQLINKAFEDSVEKGFEYKKIVDYVESILKN